jgi:hypothetical protein
LVEFALVTPLLILVLVGCFDFSRALNAYVTLANASREGARYAAVHPEEREDDIRRIVERRIAPLPTNLVVVQAFYDDGSPPASWPRWPDTGLPGGAVPRPIAFRVQVTYSLQAATALLGSFLPARTITSSSSMDAIR